MTGEVPDCSAIISVSQVCPGNGSVPIDQSLQRFRTTNLFDANYFCRTLPHTNRYSTKVVASIKGLAKTAGGSHMGGRIFKMVKQELVATIRYRFQ